MGPAAPPALEAALAHVAALAARTLPPARREEMIAAACLLGSWTVHPDGADVGGALCRDGTPIEASLGFDPQGGIETRLVTDVGAGVAGDDFETRRRRVAERCRRFAGEAAGGLIEEWIATHLARLPPTTRALAFLGAGASASRPFHRMFYFSFHGLTAAQARATLAGRLDAAIVERFWETARRLGASVEGVGYDICAGRCARLQLYARFLVEAGADLRARLAPAADDDLARSAELLSSLTAGMRAASNLVFLGLGVTTPPDSPPRLAPRLNCALAPHGADDFARLANALAALAGRWPRVPDLDGLAAGFSPTMLSAGSGAAGERIAVYFRPHGLARRRG